LGATATAGTDRAAPGPLRRALGAAPLREPALLVGLAIVTGVVGGLGAVLFRLMIEGATWVFTDLFAGRGLGFAGGPARFGVAVTPAIGLLLVGLISHRFAREVRGHGVPQILEALALHGGRIRPRVGFFGILAPAIPIGSGGSVGREGPIALIGAAFGSSVGQVLRLSDTYMSLLVACGAAAGIGATFNAPIAGGLFGLEVVLGSWAMGALVPVFVSSLTGVLIFRLIWGNQLVMPVPAYGPLPPLAVATMLLLGLLGGAVALAYSRGLEAVEEFSDRLRLPWGWQAVAAGLLVGVLGLALPGVLRVGYPVMHDAVFARYGLGMLLALLAGKYAATLLTIGGGGSGGVFAPSLFLGTMLGGAFGAALHAVLPGAVPEPAVFAVAGMGTVFAGAAQAPLTAMVILLEMTGDYHLTVSLAAACVISYLVHGSLSRDSMYTVKLSRRGVRVLRGTEMRPLQRVPIKAAMQPLGLRLLEDTPVAEARVVLERARVRALPVFRSDGAFAGILDDAQVLRATDEGLGERTAGELCRRGIPVLSPELSLDDAMRHFGLLTTDLLPVGPDAAHVLGTVGRDDALRAYYRQTVLTLETRQKVALLRDPDRGEDPGAFREVETPPGWAGQGLTVGQLDLPPGVVLVNIRRGEAAVVPRGDTGLRAGDRLLFYGADPSVVDQAAEHLLRGAARPRGIFADVRLPDDWAGDGQRVASPALRPPDGAVLVAVRRGDGLIIPHGDTALHAGDVVTVCAASGEVLDEVRRRLLEPASP
jgi:CIC family chloride channel protein